MKKINVLVIDESKTIYDLIKKSSKIKILEISGKISVSHESSSEVDLKELNKNAGQKTIIVMHTLLDVGVVDNKCKLIAGWSEMQDIKVILVCLGQHNCNSKTYPNCAAGENIYTVSDDKVKDIPGFVDRLARSELTFQCRLINDIAKRLFHQKDPFPCNGKILKNFYIALFFFIITLTIPDIISDIIMECLGMFVKFLIK